MKHEAPLCPYSFSVLPWFIVWRGGMCGPVLFVCQASLSSAFYLVPWSIVWRGGMCGPVLFVCQASLSSAFYLWPCAVTSRVTITYSPYSSVPSVPVCVGYRLDVSEITLVFPGPRVMSFSPRTPRPPPFCVPPVYCSKNWWLDISYTWYFCMMVMIFVVILIYRSKVVYCASSISSHYIDLFLFSDVK